MSQFDRKSFFISGQVITLEANELKFIKKLSSGFTGEVYKAILTNPAQEQADVAVKLMKEINFARARDLFYEEAETLRYLMDYEKEANTTQRTDIKTAPMFYFLREYDDRPFIVMEYISGVEIPAYLDENVKILESQALVLGWHLFRILHILHTKNKKTFIDLKIENLWIEEVNGAKVLRITDFGTLEKVTETNSGIKRDILLGGVYLFEMLTGQKLNYLYGELLENAESKIEKTDLTWGVKELLYRLLHRNPDARFSDAGEVANNLRSLANFWDKDVDEVVEIGRRNYSKASEIKHESPTDERINRFSGNAKSAFSVALEKDPEIITKIEFDIENVDSLLSLGNYLDRGKILFDSGSYDLAYDLFIEGKNISRNPQNIRRWSYLAGLGKDILPDKFSLVVEDLKTALNYHCDGLFQLAREKYEGLSESIISPNLNNLINDCDLFINLLEGEKFEKNRDYRSAAQKYKLAYGFLSKISDWQFIVQEETGDLSKKADNAEISANSIQKIEDIVNQASELIKENKFGQSWEILNQIFNYEFVNDQALDRLIMLDEEYLRNYEYTLAFDLSDKLIISCGRSKTQKLGWIRRISGLMINLIDFKDTEDEFSALRILDENKDLLTTEFVKKEVIRILKDLFEQALINENIFFIQELNSSFNAYLPENIKRDVELNYVELKKKVDEKDHRFIEELIKQASQLIDCEFSSEDIRKYSFTELIRIISDYQLRLEKSKLILKRVELLDIDKNYSTILKDLIQARERKNKDLVESRENFQNEITMRQESRSEIIEKDFQKIINSLNSQNKGAIWKFDDEENKEIIQMINSFFNECLRDLYFYGLNISGSREKLTKIALKIDQTAPYAWGKLALQDSIEEQDFLQKLNNVHGLLNSGKVEDAISVLINLENYKLKSSEWLQLKKLSSIIVYNNLFLDRYKSNLANKPSPDMDLVFHLKRMLDEKIPNVYLVKYPIEKWINILKEKEISWIVNHANLLKKEETLYEHIEKLLRISEVENLMAKAGILGG